MTEPVNIDWTGGLVAPLVQAARNSGNGNITVDEAADIFLRGGDEHFTRQVLIDALTISMHGDGTLWGSMWGSDWYQSYVQSNTLPEDFDLRTKREKMLKDAGATDLEAFMNARSDEMTNRFLKSRGYGPEVNS